MQMLPPLIVLLKVGFWAAWLVLLIHCLRRRRFYPVLGPGWSTKLFWLATFLFFNPLFLLLYFIFGVLLPVPAEERRTGIRWGSAAAIVLAGVVFALFEMPARPEPTEPVVLRRGQEAEEERDGLRVKAHFGVLKSNEHSSSTGFLVERDDGRFACRTVALYCETDHPLARKVTVQLQRRLLEMPWIEQVTYYPSGRGPVGDGRLADYYVRVAMPEYDRKFAPASRRIAAQFEVNAGHRPFDVGSDPMPSLITMVNSRFRYELDFEGDYCGIETPRARFEKEAQEVAESIGKAIRGHIEKPVRENGLLGPMPAYCYGTGALELPDLGTLGARTENCAAAGSSLLTHAEAYWLIKDGRPLREVLLDCRERLRELGYEGGKQLDDPEPKYEVSSLVMERGEEAVEVQRVQEDSDRHLRAIVSETTEAGKAAKRAPIQIRYWRRFDRQEVGAAMERLLAEETGTELLLMFRRVLRDQGLEGRLLEKLEAAPVRTLPEWLAMADLYLDAGESEKATAAFWRARAMARAEREHQPRGSEFKALAKRLGDEALAEQAVDEATLREAGFVRVERGRESGPVEVGLGEPACFYCLKEDGTIRTLAMTVTRVTGAAESERSYELLKVEKGKGSSSISTGGYQDGEGSLFYLGERAGGNSVHLPVRQETLTDERFRFTVGKE